VATGTDLGATRHEISRTQHHDSDLFLYREVLRPGVCTVTLSVTTG
jgi:hypothetical protein